MFSFIALIKNIFGEYQCYEIIFTFLSLALKIKIEFKVDVISEACILKCYFWRVVQNLFFTS